MVGVMFVGAWFLIHQQCCVADAGASSRTIMMDPLMRRSPLEKNFIRFGRSYPPMENLDPHHLWQPGDVEEPADKAWEDIERRETRGKENFIRFGRSMSPSMPVPGLMGNDDEWEQSGPDQLLREFHDTYDSDPRSLKQKSHDLMMIGGVLPRITRGKQNFIRFGRSSSILNKNKKYSGLNKDNFIRFGRRETDSAEDDNLLSDKFDDDDLDRDLIRATRDKGKAKGSGFIRFGKSMDHLDLNRHKRSTDIKYPPNTDDGVHCADGDASCKPCINKKPMDLDPTMIVAPEFSLLPKIPYHQIPLKKNFIRLG